MFFLSSFFWGWVADRVGRRWALILPAICGIFVTPFYLLTYNYAMIVFFLALQGCFAGGGMYAQNPTYLAERFPTEVRATAGRFCYHQGAIFGGLTAPILTFFAVNMQLGFAIPMLIGTLAGCASFIVALSLQPGDSREAIGAGRSAGLSCRYRNRADADGELPGKSCGQTNSAAVPLFGGLIPLFGEKNSAVWRRSGIWLELRLNQPLGRVGFGLRKA